MEASKPIDENPIIEIKDENPKEETKEETKDETKEETKDENSKEETKEETKEKTKEETKEETKDETKEETKETKIKKRDNYSYFKLKIKLLKILCFQVGIMILLLLLYINLYNSDIYDFIIYFFFGTAIAILFIATLVLIKKINITSSKKYIDKYASSIMIALCKKYLHLSEENTGIFIALFDLSLHLFGSIIVFIYVKKYIKRAKKTNNAYLKSLILFCIWGFINIYFNDVIKLYNKSLKITKTETTTVIISVSITYSGLLYYFETIKNEKVKLINKLINK
jgi:cation transport ATPase